MNLHLQGFKKGNDFTKKRFYRIMMLSLLLAFFGAGAWAQVKPAVAPHINTSGGGIMVTIDPGDGGGTGGGGCYPPVFTTNLITNPYTVTVNGTAPGFNVEANHTSSFQWYKSTDAITWVAITDIISPPVSPTNTVTTNYTPDVSTVGTLYYSVVAIESCATTRSNIATVTVSPAETTPVAGTISSGDATVCWGTNSTNLTLSSYTGNIQWQSSTDNVTFTNITGATNAYYTASNLTATTWYRTVVSSGGTNATSSSVAVTVSIGPTITTDVITTPYTITVNGPAPILSVVATGKGNLTYQWFMYPFYLIPNATRATYTPPSTIGTSYYYVVISDDCGSQGSSYAEVTGVPAATPVAGTISGAASVCSGTNSTTLTLSDYTGTIQWQSSTDNASFTDISGATNPSFKATDLTATTWYRTVVTSGSTTATSASVSVTVTPNATALPVTAGTSPQCINSTTTYTVSGSLLPGETGAWSSSNTAVATVDPSSGLVTAVGAGNCNIVYTVTGSCGVPVSASQPYTVTPNAFAGIVNTVISSQCVGSSTIYSVSDAVLGGGTGAWSSSDPSIARVETVDASTAFVTAVGAGSCNIVYTVTGGCGQTAPASQPYTVTPNAGAGTVTAGTSPQCIGSTTTYTVSGAVLAGGAGAWSSSNTAVATVDPSSGLVTAIGAGTANIVYSVTGGCGQTATASQPYTVTPNAGAGTVTTGTSPQCIGSTTTYTVSGAVLSGGTGSWSSDNTTVATVEASSGVVTAKSAGTCKITYTVTGGCGQIATTFLPYTVTPNASAGTVTAGTSTQCIGSTATYTVSGVVLSGGTGAWSSDNTAVATVDPSSGTVTAIGPGTCNIAYSVWSATCGGTQTASQPYTVTPNASAGTVTAGTSPQCIGSTTTYSVAGAVLGGGGYGFWSSNDPAIATVDQTGSVTAIHAGTANIVYTVTNGCSGTAKASQPYIVTPNASAGTVSAGTSPQCIGSTTTYTVSGVELGGGTGGWSSSDPLVATVTASGLVTAMSAGKVDIIYSVTDGCGGTAKASQPYTVNPSTQITRSPVDVSTPALDNTSFTVAASGAGILNYQWQASTDGGSSFTNLADNSTYLGTSGTTLTLTGVAVNMNGYRYQCIVNGTCGTSTSTSATLTVTKRPTAITYTGDNSEQYSDLQTLAATLTDQETNSLLISKPVTFSLGNQSAASVTDASGKATATLNMYQDAGQYSMVSSFAGDDTYAASSDTDPFIITKENAITNYTGPEFVSVPCATCATTPVLLSASVIDTTALYPLNDKYPGDIRKARVKFVNLDNMTDISDWLTPGLVNAADTTNGMVSYNWTVNLPTTGYDTYTIGVVVDGNYISSSQSVLSVSRSSLTQFITGGGHLVPAYSSGQYASDAGRKVNFGFNVKYNKTGKNLQGNMNIIFRRLGHVYQIKATSMTSLSINTQDPCSQKATFVSKANLIDITDENNPVSVYGGITLQTTLTDNGEPGKNDLIGITLLNGNTLIYSSNWVSKKTTEMLLNGGNLVVNSGVVCSNTIATRNEAVTVTEQTAIPPTISVNAYPNPLRDQTSIVYSLPANMHINLSVYDLLGKKVAQLQDASQGAGIHNVKFNAGNLAEGVYIYTLSALDDKGKLTVINRKLIIGR